MEKKKPLTKECYLEESGKVPLIKFYALDQIPHVELVFSTRKGGVSKGALSTLNLGFDRGDEKENVRENYRRVCETIGAKTQDLVLSDQIHETEVKYVTREDACHDTIEKKLKGIDGMITDVKGLCLATSYADCVPLFLIDPVKTVIGSSHSGWRGTVGRIGEKTVKAMEEQFGSCAEDLIVVIGPSICQKCYEVSEDVIQEFQKTYSKEQIEEIAYCSQEKEKKYQLDLWKANELQFLDVGIPKENIHVSGYCTCCHSDLLFSHRATGGKRGNLNGFLMIK